MTSTSAELNTFKDVATTMRAHGQLIYSHPLIHCERLLLSAELQQQLYCSHNGQAKVETCRLTQKGRDGGEQLGE